MIDSRQAIMRLFEDLYKRFPNGRLSEDVVDEVIVTEADRSYLVKSAFLLQEAVVVGGVTKRYYNLGPNALPLIISWRIEGLTRRLVFLTVSLTVLTAFLIGLTVVTAVR
ncbi:MAG: hypothetical protein HW414_1274 [Dehalococcoidia bacterium]|nr:hypothetical protein [Dehalococcoidia bacterium]